MSMTVQEALKVFMEYNEVMQEALRELRTAVKEEGSKKIQQHISQDNFDSANEIIAELNQFTQYEFVSNAQDIVHFIESVFSERKDNQVSNASITTKTIKTAQTKELKTKAIASVSVITEPKISESEKEFIKNLGYTSMSREKDSKNVIDEVVLNGLYEKGLVEVEEFQLGNETFTTFELSESGMTEFEELFGIEPNESLKSQLKKRFSSVEKGFFLYDVENALSERGYEVHDIGINQIEISKENRHSYLTPDTGNFEEKDYFKVLNRKNQLKNIGFVCLNEQFKEIAKISTQKWAEQNKTKCKFLTVHFTTLENIENSPTVFDTLKFS